MFKKSFLYIACFLLASAAYGQKAEKAALKATILKFFEGMEKHDTLLLKSACMPGMQLQTVRTNKNGETVVIAEPFARFLQLVATPSPEKFREVVTFKHISVEPSLASVWTPYTFYIGNTVSHTGTNSFQLVKTVEGWKIQYILDTRRKETRPKK